MRVDFVAQKQSTIEEGTQTKVFVSKRSQKYWPQPEKLFCVRVPVRAVPVARKITNSQVACFEEKITEGNATTMKICPGSSPDECGYCSCNYYRQYCKTNFLCFGIIFLI